MKSYKRLTVTALILLLLPTLSVAAISDFFVQTDWLAQNRSSVVILDVRHSPLYLLGHIEGAHSLPRSEFLELQLTDGDKLEIVTVVGGG